jgi:hypothetical protein
MSTVGRIFKGSAFLPNGTPSIPLGNLTPPNELPMPSGLPIPSDLHIAIALPIASHLLGPSGHSEPTGFYRQSKRQLVCITENEVTSNTGSQP